jgi:2-furoyl-CoA dehydrogenase large subunit
MEGQGYVGRRIKRVEDPPFLSGGGRYIADLMVPGMLYAAVLPSPHAHARILHVDAGKALKQPGVVAIVTGRDALALSQPIPIIPQFAARMYCMAVGKARYMGEPVAAVAAASRYAAEDAAEMIEVEYEPLPVILDAKEAMAPGAVLLHDEAGSNIVWHDRFYWGEEIAQALSRADLVVEERITYARRTGVPVETFGMTASYDPHSGHLTIWSNFQSPGQCHASVAGCLKIPDHNLRLITPEIGGGFGTKDSVEDLVRASLLSMAAKRPVHYQMDRLEMQSRLQGTDGFFDAKLALTREGRILGLQARWVENDGAFPRSPEPGQMQCGLDTLSGAYKIPAIDAEVCAVVSNKSPTVPVRGYGRDHCFYMLERLVDRAAQELHMDPAEIRRRNFIRADEFPYTSATGALYDSGDYSALLDKTLKAFDYEETKRQRDGMKKQGRRVGIGLACAVESSSGNKAGVQLINPNRPATGESECAMVRVDSSGKVTVALGMPSMGTGIRTVTTQIVCDILGVTPDDVHVLREFDSATHPWTTNSGTYGDRFHDVGVGAVVQAARKVRLSMLKIAAHLLEVGVEDLEITEGKVSVKGVPAKAMTIRQVATIAHRSALDLPEDVEPGLNATATYKSNIQGIVRPDSRRRINTSPAYGSHVQVCMIEVDAETGSVKILKHVMGHDCGRLLNPMIVEGQLQGGVYFGIAYGLYEEHRYDESGQLLTASFMNYIVPSALDVPDMLFVEMETPSPFTALGAKGLGDGGGIEVPPAIANAIEDALRPLKVRITEFPITPFRLFEQIQAASRP